MSVRRRAGTLTRGWPPSLGKVSARRRRWSTPTIVFALLTAFFAILSATTAQRVQQLAKELEETRRRLWDAETRTAGSSNGTP